MGDPVIQFHAELESAFGPLDWLPIPDGQIHRFHVPGDRSSSRNGWYVLHLDGFASGVFGSWRGGDSHTWRDNAPTDPDKARLMAERRERAKRQREAEQRQRQHQAAINARRLWYDATPADPDHPYLVTKRVKAHDLRQSGDALLIPLIHGGRLVNLQRIHADGSKRFMAGGRVKGCYSPIGRVEDGKALYLCEGWATGATIHEHTGASVTCAMNAGNLLNVGRHLQCTVPDTRLIVAGDDDRQTKGNPGRTAAIHTAAALGCGIVLPRWTGDEPLHLSDFNDLHCWMAGA